jgi:hypothetical protein
MKDSVERSLGILEREDIIVRTKIDKLIKVHIPFLISINFEDINN